MNKKILITVVSGIIIAIILTGVLIQNNQKPIPTEKSIPSKPITETIPTRDRPTIDILPINQTANSIAQIPVTPIPLSYDSNSILKSSLASKGISMSTPLKISGGSIAKYCAFYSDAEKQSQWNTVLQLR